MRESHKTYPVALPSVSALYRTPGQHQHPHTPQHLGACLATFHLRGDWSHQRETWPPIPCHPNPKLPRPISFSFTYWSFLSDPVSPGYIFILFKVMPPETIFYKADLLEMVTLQGWEPAKQCVRVNRVLWLSLIILTQHSCDDQTQIVCVHVCERVWMTEREVKNVTSWKAVNL